MEQLVDVFLIASVEGRLSKKRGDRSSEVTAGRWPLVPFAVHGDRLDSSSPEPDLQRHPCQHASIPTCQPCLCAGRSLLAPNRFNQRKGVRVASRHECASYWRRPSSAPFFVNVSFDIEGPWSDTTAQYILYIPIYIIFKQHTATARRNGNLAKCRLSVCVFRGTVAEDWPREGKAAHVPEGTRPARERQRPSTTTVLRTLRMYSLHPYIHTFDSGATTPPTVTFLVDGFVIKAYSYSARRHAGFVSWLTAVICSP